MKQILASITISFLTTITLTIMPFTKPTKIEHLASGLCLGSYGDTLNRYQVILTSCKGETSIQNWTVSTSEMGKLTFKLRTKKSFKALDIEKGSKDNGASIIVSPPNGGDSQSWFLDKKTGSLKNGNSGKCIDFDGFIPLVGLDLQQSDCDGSRKQRFRLI